MYESKQSELWGHCASDRPLNSSHPPLDPHHPPEVSARRVSVLIPASVRRARRARTAVLPAVSLAAPLLSIGARDGSSRKESDSC